MRTHLLGGLGLLVLLTFAGACGGSGGTAGSGGSTPAAQTSSTTTSGSAGSGSAIQIHVVLGGPTAGTWDESSPNPCNSVKDAANGTTWGVQVTNTKQDGTQLGDFEIGYMSDGPYAHKFTVQALVGDPATTSNPLYVATTLAQNQAVGGSGTVSLNDSGISAKINVDVQTKEGYPIKATVQCNKIDRV